MIRLPGARAAFLGTALIASLAPLSGTAHAGDVTCAVVAFDGVQVTPATSTVVNTNGTDFIYGTGRCTSPSGASFTMWVDIRAENSSGSAMCPSAATATFPSVAGEAVAASAKTCGPYTESNVVHTVKIWVHNSTNPTDNSASSSKTYFVR